MGTRVYSRRRHTAVRLAQTAKLPPTLTTLPWALNRSPAGTIMGTQTDLICVPQLMSGEQAPAAQIGSARVLLKLPDHSG